MKALTSLLITAIFWSCLPVFAQTDNRGVTNRPASTQTGEKRLALVIGNSNYQFTDRLKNPVNDATDVAAALKNLGFEVISATDATLPQMRKLVREFGIKLQQQKSIGLFYYAGHGIQVGGSNYLIPVDANIETAVETSDYSMDSELVLRYMREAGNEFNMVILDACRNNPFARTWRQYSPNRSLDDDKGLAKVTPPSGTIILYSTEPGKVASDGTERNGLFTESFLLQINKPNVEFDSFVKLIARDVKQKSGGKQSPWKEGLYFGEFCFSGNCNPQISNNQNSNQTTPTTNSKNGEQSFWQETEKLNFISGYERYLLEYPNGEFVRVAKLRLGKLKWLNFKSVAQNLVKYSQIITFREGVSRAVAETGDVRIINRKGEEVFQSKYSSVDSFSEGLARAKKDGKYGYVNKKGEEVIPFKYDILSESFSEGLASVTINDKWGYIDKTGKEIVPLKYDHNIQRSFSNGLAGVCLSGSCGFIDKSGKEVIPREYESIWAFSEGMANVKRNGKWGFIDTKGTVIVPFKYDSAYRFSEGLAAVKLDGELGFIDKTGKQVIPFNFSANESWYSYYFEEDLATVMIDKKVGYINRSGKMIIQPKYDYAYEFKNGLAQVIINDKKGWIDKTGKEIIPVKYDNNWCWEFIDDYIGVTLNGKKGFVDIYGNEYFDF